MVIGEHETLCLMGFEFRIQEKTLNQVQAHIASWALFWNWSKFMQKLKPVIAKAIIEDLT